MAELKHIIQDKIMNVQTIMQDIHLNILKITGDTNKDYLESQVNSVLNQSINQTGSLVLKTCKVTIVQAQ